MKTTPIEIGSYVAILYNSHYLTRQYAFICREYQGSEVEGKRCRARFGYKYDRNVRKAARQHLKDCHGSGTMYVTYETDPETREWKRIDI